MTRMISNVAIALAVILATFATAQAQRSAAPAVTETTGAPSMTTDTQQTGQQSPTLFKLGGLGVHLWAPVEPPYDANANRNFNADPLWEAGTDAIPTGY